jgi:hypothetical protein
MVREAIMALSPRTNPGHGSGTPRYPGTFLLAFREAVAELKWTVRRWRGAAVDCLDAQGKEHVVGLENLFRRARRNPREEWPALITEFLNHAIVSDRPEDLPADLDAVAENLLLRVGQPFTRDPGQAPLWTHTLEGTDLVVNLVVDYPNRMVYVTDDLVSASGKPGSDWLARAMENLHERTPMDAFEVIEKESGLVTCLTGDAYDSSRALLLDDVLPDHAADGFFVGVPCRDQLLVLPVTGPALAFVHLLKFLIEKNFKNMPYPISNQVYWVRSGAWRRFPISCEGDKVTIQPPEDFNEVLERLAPDEEISEDDGEVGEGPDAGGGGDL